MNRVAYLRPISKMKTKPHDSGKSRSALIQIIDLSWDKSARGGKLAAWCNAVPTAFAIPAERLLIQYNGSIHIDEQYWGHANEFLQPLRCHHHQRPLNEAYEHGCLNVQYSQETLNVTYIWNWWNAGAPERHPMKKLVMPTDTWARVSWNGRSSDTDSGVWSYRHVIVNIALFNGQPDGDIFLKTKPHRQLEKTASWW